MTSAHNMYLTTHTPSRLYGLQIILVSLLLGLLATSMQAQEKKSTKHELGVTPFRIEANSATHNAPFVPKGIFGAYYQRDLGNSNFSWYSAIDYGLNRVNDDTRKHPIRTHGIGFLTELHALSGFRFFPFKGKLQRVRPFLHANLQFSGLRYEGSFDVNFMTNQSGSRLVFGPSTGIGISMPLLKVLQFTACTSIRYGIGKFEGQYYFHPEVWVEDAAFIPIQLNLGYRF